MRLIADDISEIICEYVIDEANNDYTKAKKDCKNCKYLDKIRAELVQLIQNGVLRIESGNEALFNVIDKYKTESEG